METWKIHKFCEGASLKELIERREQLMRLVDENRLANTNAKRILELVDEYIELKSLFEND